MKKKFRLYHDGPESAEEIAAEQPVEQPKADTSVEQPASETEQPTIQE